MNTSTEASLIVFIPDLLAKHTTTTPLAHFQARIDHAATDHAAWLFVAKNPYSFRKRLFLFGWEPQKINRRDTPRPTTRMAVPLGTPENQSLRELIQFVAPQFKRKWLAKNAFI
jgi:hypothetical protein